MFLEDIAVGFASLARCQVPEQKRLAGAALQGSAAEGTQGAHKSRKKSVAWERRK